MKKKKYIVIGDTVRSKSDGQEHFVPAFQLCRLFQLDPEECHLMSSQDPDLGRKLRTLSQVMPRFYPSESGNYPALKK